MKPALSRYPGNKFTPLEIYKKILKPHLTQEKKLP
jgi:hypothetical protein